MKKGLKVLIVAILIAILVTIFQNPIHRVMEKILPHIGPTATVLIHQPKEMDMNEKVVEAALAEPIPKTTNKENVNTPSELEALLAALPESIQAEISPWTFCMATREELKSLGFANVVGLTDYQNKTVYFREGTAVSKSFYHELGHVLASNRGNPDYDVTFLFIYSEEKDSLVDVHEQGDRHCATDQREFFATIVDDIFTSGNTYEETAPKGFAYVRATLGL